MNYKDGERLLMLARKKLAGLASAQEEQALTDLLKANPGMQMHMCLLAYFAETEVKVDAQGIEDATTRLMLKIADDGDGKTETGNDKENDQRQCL